MSAFANFEELDKEYQKTLSKFRNLCEEKKDKGEWTEENSAALEQLFFDFAVPSEIVDWETDSGDTILRVPLPTSLDLWGGEEDRIGN